MSIRPQSTLRSTNCTSQRFRKFDGLCPRRCLSIEHLESRHLLAAQFVISEFMTDNDLFLLDGDGQSPDWIEIHNPGTEEANLEGWYLTDQADEPTKWQFPNVEISPGGHLVVFASATGEVDYVDPAGNLHTNFQLNRTGEYLALVQPDGATLASEFKFHQQFENVSYGVTRERSEIDLIGEDVRSRWLVPQDDALSLSWTQTDFDDESWNPGSGPYRHRE